VAVIFDIASMQADLKVFAKATPKFIQNKNRLLELESQLANAVAASKMNGEVVYWSTKHGGTEQPIRTNTSRTHRHKNKAPKPLFAEVSFKYKGVLENKNTQIRIMNGSSSIRLFWEGSVDCTLCHFDIHPGVDGHPTLHVQFEGHIKEIPRIPSFFAHPLDILEFTLMEVFQDNWRRDRITSTVVSVLHRYPAKQRSRIISLMSTYRDWLVSDESSPAALLTLQKTPTAPFDLYP
jgi:hypothetical protein